MSIDKAFGDVLKGIVDQITDKAEPTPSFELDVTDDVAVCKFKHMPKSLKEYEGEIKQLIAAWLERRVIMDR